MAKTAQKLELTVEPGKQELFVRRVFDAPRELVFKAMTDPKAVPQWWGPRGYETVVDTMSAKTGGSWRFIHKDSAGMEFGFHGVYHDVVLSERIVQTFEFEGMPGHAILESMSFEDFEGGTRILGQSVFQSVEDRDGMVAAGMEGGLRESYERLDEYLAKTA